MGKSVYEIVTGRIIDELEKGNIPWHKGWSGAQGGAYNYVNRKPYGILNQLLLSRRDAYITPRQLEKLGGHLNEGVTKKDSEIVTGWFYTIKKKKKTDNDGNEVEVDEKQWSFRYYTVYWIGLTDLERKDVKLVENDPIDEAEKMIQEYVNRERGLKFVNDDPSDSAYYAPMLDTVVVPMMNQFKNVEEYYSTAFHELAHSTGAKNRLDRFESGKCAPFGSEDYSKEELVAELSASALVNICGIETEKSFRNNAAYIQSWLKVLKNDSKMIVSASSKADKAVKYIMDGTIPSYDA